VFASLQRTATDWARLAGIRPRNLRAFGASSNWAGTRFRPDDRVIIVGTMPAPLETALTTQLATVGPAGPTLERVTLDLPR